MSKRFLHALAIVGSLSLISIPSLFAGDGLDVKANIPFSFHAGKETLAKGEYEIRQKADDPGTLVVRSANGKKEEFVLTNEVTDPNLKHKSELVFDLFGTEHYLKQVWEEGLVVGREVPLHEGKSSGSVRVGAQHVGPMKKAAKASHY